MKETPKVRHLDQCRVCSSPRQRRFLNLEAMPLTDDFIPAADFGREFRHDIKVYLCPDCLTVQTQHNVDMGDYYEDYQYAVGASATANRFMRLLAANLVERYLAGRGKLRVLEIGSGDGAQLLAFKELGCEVMGFEPSSTLAREAESKGVPTIKGLFTQDSARDLPAEFREVDVVMLSYTFDHLPQPREFLAAARGILNPEHGLLVVEVHDLEKILQRKEFCLFEHEHTVYLTQATASAMAALEGLTVIDFDLVPEQARRANSLIFVATPAGSRIAKAFPAAPPVTPAEFARPEFYDQQAASIAQGIANADAFVERVVASGKSIAGYGAGGRGVMTLAAMRTARKLRYLGDRKPKRDGLVAPKSGVPLVGLPEFGKTPVDEILVFSFGYIDEIRKDLGAFGYRPNQCHSLLDALAGGPVL